jgi:hypothetical protein
VRTCEEAPSCPFRPCIISLSRAMFPLYLRYTRQGHKQSHYSIGRSCKLCGCFHSHYLTTCRPKHWALHILPHTHLHNGNKLLCLYFQISSVKAVKLYCCLHRILQWTNCVQKKKSKELWLQYALCFILRNYVILLLRSLCGYISAVTQWRKHPTPSHLSHVVFS